MDLTSEARIPGALPKNAPQAEKDIAILRVPPSRQTVTPVERFKLVRKLLEQGHLYSRPMGTKKLPKRISDLYDEIIEKDNNKAVAYLLCKRCRKIVSTRVKTKVPTLMKHIHACPENPDKPNSIIPELYGKIPDANAVVHSVFTNGNRARSHLWAQICMQTFEPPRSSSSSPHVEWTRIFLNPSRAIYCRSRMTKFSTGLHYGTTCDFVEITKDGIPKVSTGRCIIPEIEYSTALLDGKVRTAQAFTSLFVINFQKYDQFSYPLSSVPPIIQSSSP